MGVTRLGLLVSWGLMTSGALAIGFPQVPRLDFHGGSRLDVSHEILKV